jgi:hypothetical protein
MALAHCTETQRGLGDQCLRNADCLSGYCAGQTCVASPAVFEGAAPFDASPDAAAEGAVSSDGPSPSDAAMSKDTGVHPHDAGTADAHVADSGADRGVTVHDTGATDSHAPG